MRRGAMTVEFALLLPILFAVIFGLVDWSWYMYQTLAVTRAAQWGARISAGTATANDPVSTATEAARASLTGQALDGTGADVTSTVVTRPYGNVVVVEIELPFVPIIGLVGVPEWLRGRATAAWYGDFGT